MEGVELYSLKLPEPSDPEIDKLCEEFRTLSTALAVTSVLSPNDDRFWTDTRTWPELDAPEDLKTKLLNASPSKSPQEGCSSASLRRDVWIILNYSSTRIAHSSLHLASYILQCSILTLILLNVVVAIVDSSQGPRTQKKPLYYSA